MKDFRFTRAKPYKEPKAKTAEPAEIEKKVKRTLKLDSEIGVYAITCIESKSVYVGQSKSINSRFEMHKRALKNGDYKFRYPEWQADYNMHGLTKFSFEILQNCDEDELLKWETHYLKLYDREKFKIYNHLLETEDNTIVNCPKQYSDLINKILKGLQRGTISPDDLERGLIGF